jgi:hypothetical protein
MPNILQLAKELEGVSDDRLMQEANAPNVFPPHLTLAEILRREKDRAAYQSRQNQMPQGTVKDQVISRALQGIGSISQPQQTQPMPAAMAMAQGGPPMDPSMMQGPPMMQGGMPPQGGMPMQMPMGAMAEGGIVGYSNGGQAQGYSDDPDDLEREMRKRMGLEESYTFNPVSSPFIESLIDYVTAPSQGSIRRHGRSGGIVVTEPRGNIVSAIPSRIGEQEEERVLRELFQEAQERREQGLPGLGGSLEDSQALDRLEAQGQESELELDPQDVLLAELKAYGRMGMLPGMDGSPAFSNLTSQDVFRGRSDLTDAYSREPEEQSLDELGELERRLMRQIAEQIEEGPGLTSDQEAYYAKQLEQATNARERARIIEQRDRERLRNLATDRTELEAAMLAQEQRLANLYDPEQDAQDQANDLAAIVAGAIASGRFQEGGIGGALARGITRQRELREAQEERRERILTRTGDLEIGRLSRIAGMREIERDLLRSVEAGVITADEALEAANLAKLKAQADASVASEITSAQAMSILSDIQRIKALQDAQIRGRAQTPATGSAILDYKTKILDNILKLSEDSQSRDNPEATLITIQEILKTAEGTLTRDEIEGLNMIGRITLLQGASSSEAEEALQRLTTEMGIDLYGLQANAEGGLIMSPGSRTRTMMAQP